MSVTMSRFGAKTEAREVTSSFASEIKSKTFLVTGVSPNGLGEDVALNIASHGPSLLILSGRNASKVHSVMNAIGEKHPNVQTRFLQMDLSSFESIRNAAKEVNAHSEPSIDVLINNAGVMNIPERQLSADGFEMHLAANYLGPYLFTAHILDKLASSGKGRIVNVASNGYMFSPFRFSDYNFDENKSAPDNEKPLREILQLAKLEKSRGISATSVNPGAIATELWRHMPKETTQQIHTMLLMKSMSEGASTILVAALDPKLSQASGGYLADCQIEEVLDFVKDERKAQQLWELTKTLTAA